MAQALHVDLELGVGRVLAARRVADQALLALAVRELVRGVAVTALRVEALARVVTRNRLVLQRLDFDIQQHPLVDTLHAGLLQGLIPGIGIGSSIHKNCPKVNPLCINSTTARGGLLLEG